MTLPFSGPTNFGSSGTTEELDYRNFKTPFFKIFVAKGRSGNFQELSVDLYKLVKKIEIQEHLNSCHHTAIKLEILEGSREPFTPNTSAEASLYGDQSQGDNFTNSTGFVVDLRFSGGGGFTSLAPGLIGAATAAQGLGDTALGNSDEGNVESDAPTLVNSQEQSFLFSPRNRIKIVWGYLENPLQRQVVANINIVRTNFPESGQPITEIACFSGSSELVQFTTENTVVFKNTGISAGLLAALGISDDDEDITVEEVLDNLESEHGFRIIRSEEFTATKLDSGITKRWVAGQTLHEFLLNLSNEVDAYYNTTLDPETGKTVIYFLKEDELERSVRVTQKDLMTYKKPGSILKSVNITADFASVHGKTNKGYNEKGEKVVRRSPNGQEHIVLFEGQTAADTNSTEGPTASEAGLSLASAANNNLNGNVEIMPHANDPEYMQSNASNQGSCKPIVLEFSTLGYTKLGPGTAPFFGLGERYSGWYTIQSISHIIDDNGYTCRGMAKGHGQGGGEGFGVSPVGDGTQVEPTETVQLFTSLTEVSSES